MHRNTAQNYGSDNRDIGTICQTMPPILAGFFCYRTFLVAFCSMNRRSMHPITDTATHAMIALRSIVRHRQHDENKDNTEEFANLKRYTLQR